MKKTTTTPETTSTSTSMTEAPTGTYALLVLIHFADPPDEAFAASVHARTPWGDVEVWRGALTRPGMVMRNRGGVV